MKHAASTIRRRAYAVGYRVRVNRSDLPGQHSRGAVYITNDRNYLVGDDLSWEEAEHLVNREYEAVLPENRVAQR